MVHEKQNLSMEEKKALKEKSFKAGVAKMQWQGLADIKDQLSLKKDRSVSKKVRILS